MVRKYFYKVSIKVIIVVDEIVYQVNNKVNINNDNKVAQSQIDQITLIRKESNHTNNKYSVRNIK